MKNWLKYYKDGSKIATKYEPMFMPYSRKRKYATENPDILVDGKWYNSTNGVEKVTNGTFDVDTTGWVDNTLANLTVVNGTLRVTNNSTGYGSAIQSFSTIIGEEYTIKTFGTPLTATLAVLNVGTTSDGGEIGALSTSTGELLEITFIARATTTYVSLRANNNGAGTYCDFDNVTCYPTKIEPDTVYTTQFSYLPVAVNVDTQGNPVTQEYYYIPTLVEKAIMAERIVSTGNRVMKEIGTIYNNKRYVIPHTEFFSDYTGNPEDYDAVVQIYSNGVWYEPYYTKQLDSSGWGGSKASSSDEGIVVQTGASYISTASNRSGSVVDVVITNAPARVIVTYVGVTK